MIDLSPLATIGLIAVTASLVMAAIWLLQRKTGDAGVVDVAWSVGVGLSGIFAALAGGGDPVRRALVAVLAGIWGFRLAWYILRDRVLRGEEDGRYRQLREMWGERASRNLFLFFQAQALFVVLFALPLVGAAQVNRGLDLWLVLSVAIWTLAVLGESIADRQLARFRSDPGNRGKTCREGLWRFSRHPNYFFEWVHWWAYVALAVGSGWVWMTLAGPVLMFLFLFQITGIPHTERQALRSRGDDYREYQRTTSVFIPWFPKEAPK